MVTWDRHTSATTRRRRSSEWASKAIRRLGLANAAQITHAMIRSLGAAGARPNGAYAVVFGASRRHGRQTGMAPLRRRLDGLCKCRLMPAGLDGNPDPIVTDERDRVLAATAQRVLEVPTQRTLVAVDGRAGAGKSTFGDELAGRLAESGRQVVRSTTDAFHRPRAERMRLGATSAEGYYLESHQLDVIVEELLRPFSAKATEVLVAAFDEPTDSPTREIASVDDTAILVFDGLFLQRPEFEEYWDITVLLEAHTRGDEGWLGFLLADLPEDATGRADAIDERLRRARWPRYRDGWRIYVDAVDPAHRATLVVNNNNLARPRLI